MADPDPPTYYHAAGGHGPERPPLAGDQRTDICVVGGGLAGVSTALALAERGRTVTLLEAQRVGWGASGRNGGQAHVGFSPGMERVEAMLGLPAARALWDMTLAGLGSLEMRVRRHDIPCDLRRGYLLAARRPGNMAEHEAWAARAARDYGFDGYRVLDAGETRRAIASDRYHGALFDTRSVHLDPLAYLRGLARAAEAVGVVIHEGTAVSGIETAGPPRAVTPSGTVTAESLVLAGNAHLGGVAPAIRSRVMPVGTYVCATEPLGSERARALVPGGQAVCDDAHVLDYFRVTGDGRLLFGGGVSYSGLPPRDLRAFMRRHMLRVFPQLEDVAVAHAWGGHVAITRNRLPDVGRLAPAVYYAQGFSGQGLVLTGVAGNAIAAALCGEGSGFDLLARFRHRPFPGGPALRMPLLVMAQLWYRMKDLF